jgi:hypothetical protein
MQFANVNTRTKNTEILGWCILQPERYNFSNLPPAIMLTRNPICSIQSTCCNHRILNAKHRPGARYDTNI